MNFEISHTLPADRDTVLAIMLDAEYYKFCQAHHSGVDRIEMLQQEDQGNIVRRRVLYQPKPIIRRIGPKEIPPDAMAWTEESTLDKAAYRLRFTNVAAKDWVRKRLANSGTIELRAAGPDRTTRVVAGELKVKFPILGGIAERIIYGKAKDILDEEARVFEKYLRERKAK